MRKALSNRPVNVDFGILLLRLGIGLPVLVLHGWDKISGGSAQWTQIGSSMTLLGLGFAPTFWGFMAAFSEFFASAFIVLGLLFRPMTLLLAFTMFVAVLVHLNMPAENPNSGILGASHALELMVVYVALFFAGAGRFSVTFTRSED
jgi:putative oxidoreductase